MTCIVGIADKGKVWMGCDSIAYGSDGLKSIRAEPKVFSMGEDYIFGFVDSFRLGDLLQYQLSLPPAECGKAFLVNRFIPRLRECLIEHGHAKEGDNMDGAFLLGVRGKLYEVCEDFQIGEILCGYQAIGAGAPAALGSLYTSEAWISKPRRMKTALCAAAEFHLGVAPPYFFEVLS
jgi:hypothetical protein